MSPTELYASGYTHTVSIVRSATVAVNPHLCICLGDASIMAKDLESILCGDEVVAELSVDATPCAKTPHKLTPDDNQRLAPSEANI